MLDVGLILERFGSVPHLLWCAERAGMGGVITPASLSKWRLRGSISFRGMSALSVVARKEGISLPLERCTR
jgi:hypothetical protein